MARKPSPDLFNLVKSLTLNEKRYLKIHILHQSKKYLTLYQLITKQKEFDDESLKQQLYSSDVGANTFSEIKKYLYHFILKTLVAFEEVNFVEIRLKSGLQKLLVLHKRGMIDECQRLLVSLLKMAEKNDNQLIILELKDWERILAYSKFDVGFLSAELMNINQRTSNAVERIQTLEKLKAMYYSLLVMSINKSNMDGMSNDLLKSLDAMMEKLPLKVKGEDYEEQKWRLKIFSYYAELTNNEIEFFERTKELFYLMSNSGRDEAREFIPVIDKLMKACRDLHKFSESEEYLKAFLKVAESKSIGFPEKQKAICSHFMNSTITSIIKGDLDESLVQVEEFIAMYDAAFYKPYKLHVSIMIAQTYFLCMKYKEALFWIDGAIDHSNSLLRQDLQVLSRCINMILHYEIGNHIYLISLIRSTNRLLQKNMITTEYDLQLMKLLKKLIQHEHNKEVKLRLLRTFRNGLGVDKYYSNIKEMNLLKFAIWLDSKITGKTPQELLMEQYELITQV